MHRLITEKTELHMYCVQLVAQRLEALEAEIKNLQSDAQIETKSSAGDKYETGRAMVQLEIERLLSQLNEERKFRAALQNLKPEAVSDKVLVGSLVRTDKGIFYIAISLGSVKFSDKQYFVVSAESPIAKQLMGKSIGDSVPWLKGSQTILAID